MSFGRDLWDQVKVVETFAEHGVQFMDKANEFMKQVATLEAEHARNLLKLAKQHREEIMRKASDKANAQFYKAILGSTLMQSWCFILSETENIATYRLEAADKLDSEIRKNLKHRGRDNEKANKQHFDDIRKANADLKKAVDNLEKTQQRYEKAMKELELAHASLETSEKDQNSTKKLVDQLKADVDKKAIAAQEASAAYKQSMVESNEIKNKHFNEILPSILDIVQHEDEDFRITFCKISFQQYVNLCSSLVPRYEQSYKLMGKSIETIKPTGDSEYFATMFKTGETVPEDFHMSDTQETDLNKKSFMKGMARVGDDQAEDQIVAMPYKQGKRKAVDRAKMIEKEIAEVEKKRQGIETLISVYKDKSPSSADSKIMDDLMDQKANLERRIDTLAFKRHKLMVYISAIDGVSPPEMPTPLQDKLPVSKPSSTATPVSSTPIRDSPASAINFGNVSPNAWEDSGSKESVGASSKSPVESSFSGNIPVNIPALIGRARVLYDFEAAPGSQEMSVKSGQVLDIVEKQDDGWWLCRNSGREGYVPGNYTEAV